MHRAKKQQQTVRIYAQLANKSDIRPVFLSFLTSVVLLQWRNLNRATRSADSLLCDVTLVVMSRSRINTGKQWSHPLPPGHAIQIHQNKNQNR